jgi:hypothetical protein
MVTTISIYEMCSLLVQQGLFKGMNDEEKDDLMEWTYSAIQFCLSNEISREITGETIVIRL